MSASAVEASFQITGLIDDPLFHKAAALVQAVQEKQGGEEIIEAELVPLLEPDWEEYRHATVHEHGGAALSHHSNTLVLKDGAYVGGYDALARVCEETWQISIPDVQDVVFKDRAVKALQDTFTGTGNPYCFMDIKVPNVKTKRVFFELFDKICPKTCENFIALCSGKDPKLSYKNNVFHRIVKGGWVQAGDIVNRNGTGGASIFGEVFPDESFQVTFDQPGVLAMANHGPHTNASQFFVTTAPLEWMNRRSVAFGRVVKGMPTIRKVENMPTDGEAPVGLVKIEKVGLVDLESTQHFK